MPCFYEEEISSLLKACKSDSDPVRSTAMVLFLLGTGARANEFCQFTVNDVDTKTGVVKIKWGKGGKYREVFLGPDARKALSRYMLKRRVTSAGREPLFPSVNDPLRPMTPNSLLHWAWRMGEQAGVAHCNPHAFRRTFATRCLDNGMDVFAVQRLMGHCDLTVLMKYVNRQKPQLRKAHQQYGVVASMKLRLPAKA